MAADDLNPKEFEAYRNLIYRISGIRVPDSKRSLLSSRIRKCLRSHEGLDFAAYLHLLASGTDSEETARFIDAVTTNETFFFRHPDQFEWFQSSFITELTLNARRGLRQKSLRVLSAACSTGEEAYSLAICIAENSLRLRDWDVQVVGTDISAEAIRKAESGLYNERSLKEVDDRRRRRYFVRQPEGGTWKVQEKIRQCVSFRQHNLMDRLAVQPFDCIFLRNVLIYFDRPSRRTVVNNLWNLLAPNGYLVAGPAEGIYDLLERMTKRSINLYQNCGPSPSKT